MVGAGVGQDQQARLLEVLLDLVGECTCGPGRELLRDSGECCTGAGVGHLRCCCMGQADVNQVYMVDWSAQCCLGRCRQAQGAGEPGCMATWTIQAFAAASGTHARWRRQTRCDPRHQAGMLMTCSKGCRRAQQSAWATQQAGSACREDLPGVWRPARALAPVYCANLRTAL